MSIRQPEDKLVFDGGITRQMRSGTERITFRAGHRLFTKDIKLVNKEKTESIEGSVNKIAQTILLECPFIYFGQYGWKNMQEVLDGLRLYYPEIGINDRITVVFYRVNIPIKGE